jgi:hypothetical protein
MNVPADLLYTKDHEWLRVEGDNGYVGITDFAQGELGDIVFVEIETVGEALGREEVFGTIEAVKTVSDMFMPVGGYLSGTLETRPFAMPSFFDISRISREQAPPPPPPTNVQQCPTCGKPLTFVPQYKRSYCTNCKKYS